MYYFLKISVSPIAFPISPESVQFVNLHREGYTIIGSIVILKFWGVQKCVIFVYKETH